MVYGGEGQMDNKSWGGIIALGMVCVTIVLVVGMITGVIGGR